MSGKKLNDYPKFGVWPDAYYMSANQFRPSGFAGVAAVASERDKMLVGDPLPMVAILAPARGQVNAKGLLQEVHAAEVGVEAEVGAKVPREPG